jgi:hypothetical protein
MTTKVAGASEKLDPDFLQSDLADDRFVRAILQKHPSPVGSSPPSVQRFWRSESLAWLGLAGWIIASYE